MEAYERLIKYAQIYTASDPSKYCTPTTERQFDLARVLEAEMKEMGLEDVYLAEHCYVYGHIPATPGYESAPAIGFGAHIDTASDFPGENVHPCIVEKYEGGDIPLGNTGKVISPKILPHLNNLIGRKLITTDGTTLLGADNKAGMAEIMTACERILASDKPHGKVCVCFSPDEEVGRGTVYYDLERFGADFAYTVDGGKEGSVDYENFNACTASFEVHGYNIHPGDSKNAMINANLVAMEINSMLPSGQTPRGTEMYEGYFHLTDMVGTVEKATLNYIVRDHDATLFDGRKKTLQHIEKLINERWGEGTATLTIKDQYRNMAEIIRPNMHLIDNAIEVIKSLGMTPKVTPIRGGTDGSNLCYMGLPCPNLGSGSFAHHGPYEHASAEGMDLCAKVIEGIVYKYADMKK